MNCPSIGMKNSHHICSVCVKQLSIQQDRQHNTFNIRTSVHNRQNYPQCVVTGKRNIGCSCVFVEASWGYSTVENKAAERWWLARYIDVLLLTKGSVVSSSLVQSLAVIFFFWDKFSQAPLGKIWFHAGINVCEWRKFWLNFQIFVRILNIFFFF